ncbi:MAG: cyclic nucleotide-binding domain-containing protein [Myxococcales bacterium]|nr:cyclic nucleotide-binding domain-containing protein [Myxococcales bacterium]
MRTAPPDLPGSHTAESPLDRALTLMLAGERDAALRWAAAVVQHDPSLPSSLILTSRLLADAGRTEAAIEGFTLGLKRAIDAGNLPLAIAAIGDLRALGVDVGEHLDGIAEAFCAGSPRLADVATPPPPPLPHLDEFQTLSSFLTGPALLSKATEIIHDASQEYESVAESEPPLITPLPLFSHLEKAGLRALIECFEMVTVAAGKNVISEGEEGAEAYIVARGELEVRREIHDPEGDETVTLARLTNGALFGEMALLSRAPRAASVVACRPSILLVARRDALEAVAEKRPEVGVELAAHCRRRMVANLVRTSPVLLAVPPDERAALVERFETKVFEKGERLIADKEEPTGLHLIASGEVAVVGHEGDNGESFVIATLGVGDVVGEVALVLRRKASADVAAVHPTVTLHLPREDFMALIRDHPAILAGLYLLAVARDEETKNVLTMSTTTVAEADEYVLV